MAFAKVTPAFDLVSGVVVITVKAFEATLESVPSAIIFLRFAVIVTPFPAEAAEPVTKNSLILSPTCKGPSPKTTVPLLMDCGSVAKKPKLSAVTTAHPAVLPIFPLVVFIKTCPVLGVGVGVFVGVKVLVGVNVFVGVNVLVDVKVGVAVPTTAA